MTDNTGFSGLLWVDPLTGNKYAVEVQGGGKVRIKLRSGESMILQTFNEPQPDLQFELMPRKKFYPSKENCININKGWKLSFIEEAPKVNDTFDIDTLRTWEGVNNSSAKITMGTGVYETSFDLPSGTTDCRCTIDLGDVRESARVYINDVYVGCAWCVPYVLNFDGKILKRIGNHIRIEVTNLPANRIADMDRRGVQWRKFDDINIVNINYKHRTYNRWKPMPSGLNSSVRIYLDI